MNGSNYRLIASWVDEGCHLLDLGCGTGDLLAMLAKEKKVNGIGIEIDEKLVAACVGKGLQVVNVDIESDLGIFEDKIFDCAVLSQTLMEMRDPPKLLKEMMRVSKRSIVSITNASHWSKRLSFLKGTVPKEEGVDTHSISRLISVADFEGLCKDIGMRIIERRYLSGDKTTSMALSAETAVYLLSSPE